MYIHNVLNKSARLDIFKMNIEVENIWFIQNEGEVNVGIIRVLEVFIMK